jgi:PiT family inorganic phosphate transporter
MGIILAVLILAGNLPADTDVPLWVVVSAHIAIALGTLLGGWRIVKTMGSRITKLQPVGGVADSPPSDGALPAESCGRGP